METDKGPIKHLTKEKLRSKLAQPYDKVSKGKITKNVCKPASTSRSCGHGKGTYTKLLAMHSYISQECQPAYQATEDVQVNAQG